MRFIVSFKNSITSPLLFRGLYGRSSAFGGGEGVRMLAYVRAWIPFLRPFKRSPSRTQYDRPLAAGQLGALGREGFRGGIF